MKIVSEDKDALRIEGDAAKFPIGCGAARDRPAPTAMPKTVEGAFVRRALRDPIAHGRDSEWIVAPVCVPQVVSSRDAAVVA